MAEVASAYVSILPSFKGGASSITKQVEGPIRASGSSLGKTFGKLFAVSAGFLIAGGVTNLLKGSIDEAREAQKVGAQTNAVLKSTGGIANVSADQVGKLATALSVKIGVDDEAIQSGENMLLTFRNVRNEVGKGNDIFNQATVVVQDMAAAFGGDAVSNSKILGKALNDPVKGVTALTRVGVTFTEKQKDQIKTLVDSGNTLKAQKVILGELTKETQGSAVAQATAGEKASVAFKNLQEQIGTALLPLIDKLAGIFTNTVAPAISVFVAQLQSGEGVGGRFAQVFSTLGDVLATVFGFINANRTVTTVFVAGMIAMTAATAAFNLVLDANPISLVIIAIAALAAGIVYAYKHSETFKRVVDVTFKGIQKVVTAVIGFVVPFIKNHWQLLIAIIGGPLGIVVGLVIKHFGTVKKVVAAAAEFVVGTAKFYAKFAVLVGEHIARVVSFFRQLPGKIKSIMAALPGQLKQIGADIVNGLVRGIQGAAHLVESAVQAIINKIPKKIRSLMGIGSPSKVTAELGGYIGDGLAKGIADSTAKVGNAAEKLTKKIKEKIAKLRDTLASVRSDFASLVDPIASNFTQGLFDFNSAAAFTANLTTVKGTLTTLLANFKKLIGEGLSPGFLYQLFASGGPGLINSLAALDAAGAQQAGSLFGQVTDLSQQLGTAVAGATAKGGALEDQTVRLEKKLDKLIEATKDNAHEVGNQVNGAAASGHRRGVNGGRRAA